MKRKIKVRKILIMIVVMNHLLMKVDRAVTVIIVKVIIVMEKERNKNRMIKMGSGKNLAKLIHQKINDNKNFIIIY